MSALSYVKLIVFLESKDYNIDSSEISLVPENTVKISNSDSDELLKLLELLEEYDDVNVKYSLANSKIKNEFYNYVVSSIDEEKLLS